MQNSNLIKIKKPDNTEDSIIWTEMEYKDIQRDISWYWIIGGIAVSFIIIAIAQGNFFFAVFSALAGIMVIVLSLRSPEMIEFAMNNKNICVGKIKYEYDDFENFSIRNRDEQLNEIILKKRTIINPWLRIPINLNLFPRVEKKLLEKIPKVEYDESLMDIVSDWIGI